MCTLSGITLFINVASYLKFFLGVMIFMNGVFFCTSADVLQAFGDHFVEIGAGMIVLGFLSAIVVFATRFGTQKHNRFLLVLSFIVDTIVFASYIAIAVDIESFTIPHFSKDLQIDCLRHSPRKHTLEECSEYYQSDRTAGQRLVWEHYYSESSKKSIAVLAKLQETCCGFFAPLNCIENEDPFPSYLHQIDIDPEYLKQRVSCGTYPGYYIEQETCRSFYDFSNGIIGGCNFDMGVGACVDKVAIRNADKGCADMVEDYVVSLIFPAIGALTFAAILTIMFMMLECCMWWKRKSTDVFPEHKETELLKVNYSKVKYQFEVFPKHKSLHKEGFLPNDEESTPDGGEQKESDNNDGGQGTELFQSTNESK